MLSKVLLAGHDIGMKERNPGFLRASTKPSRHSTEQYTTKENNQQRRHRHPTAVRNLMYTFSSFQFVYLICFSTGQTNVRDYVIHKAARKRIFAAACLYYGAQCYIAEDFLRKIFYRDEDCSFRWRLPLVFLRTKRYWTGKAGQTGRLLGD